MKTKVCLKCRSIMPYGEEFCPSCGIKVDYSKEYQNEVITEIHPPKRVSNKPRYNILP